MKSLKKGLSLLLVFVFAAGLLTGCSKEKGKTAGSVPMGRYVEGAIAMPEKVENGEEYAIRMVLNPQKLLEVFAMPQSGEYVTKYVLQGNTWKGENIKALAGKEFTCMNYTYGTDGLLYFTSFKQGKDGNIEESKIMRLNGKGETEEVPEGDLGEEYVRDLQAYGENQYIASLYSRAWFLNNGKVLDFNQQDALDSVYGQRDLLMGIMGPNHATILYDLKTGKEIKEISTDGNAGIISGDGENWYLLTKSGIHRMALNGDAWETLVDGDQNSMSKPGLTPEGFVKLGEELYVMYQGENGKRELKKYVYDPNIASRPETSLSVVTIQENETLRQAAVDFQKKNPNVSVEIRVMGTGESGQTLTDQIKTVNTELLAGKGADIILTDQMPVDSFIEKGVLEDLSPLVKRLEEDGRLKKGIAGNGESSGGIYTIPVRIGIPFYFGQEEALEKIATLEQLKEEAEKDGTALLGDGFMSREALLGQLYRLYGDSLLDKKGSADEKAFVTFLEQARVIIDSCHAKAGAEDSIIDMDNKYNTTAGMLYEEGSIRLAYGELENLYDTIVPWEIIKRKGGSYLFVGDKYIPHGLVGLNHASKQKELAEQFIEFLFSEEVQSANVSEGFSVNPAVLEGLVDYEDDFLIRIAGSDGKNIDATLMDKERRKELIGRFDGLKSPLIQDAVFEEMLIEGTKEFFDGTKDAEETLQILSGKLKVYLSE